MKRILLDCDTGIDDALAIIYGIRHGAQFAGIGSVHGNVPAPLAAANTLRVLDVLGAAEIPVRVGAARPIAQPLCTAEHVHGADGLGNTNLPPPKRSPYPGSAAEQIVSLAHRFPGELTLVAIGPLTNVALALLLDPELPALIPDVIVMGGVVQPPGNVTPLAEANIWHDPEAAALVIEAAWSVTFVTLDVTMRTLLREDQLAAIANAATPHGRFAWSVLQFYLDAYERRLATRTCPLHDPLALALALDPSLATYRSLPTRIELRGETSRGMAVCDLRGPQADRDSSWHDVRYVAELDIETFHHRFLDALLS
ncbi:Inosine/uridine-preferring nucleoside hydrolase [Acidothermus cellulolyticus 11B]|uniref:Inosine/uridine-preferring nucleoside hydrolase n=1 Tax=Acidothermus cellulolyticus (strain ATCC 43068 / DSM 8971 / 11B) TaxID=351607 RepID=A0LUY7_ACIC1|nr:nucleoside hydrolase [Acidothermus cellulolyticus]ABK53247.1 Inosine/uridine-preferring nucleoside hydrolase [Acidothermus cellulolyticus 11B]